MLFLYKLGLAWWPEASCVGLRHIGRYPPTLHDYVAWRERRFGHRRLWRGGYADQEAAGRQAERTLAQTKTSQQLKRFFNT